MACSANKECHEVLQGLLHFLHKFKLKMLQRHAASTHSQHLPQDSASCHHAEVHLFICLFVRLFVRLFV